MYKGGERIRVETDRSFEEVCSVVTNILHHLGPVHMTKSGRFTIEDRLHSGTFTDVRYRGDVCERKDGRGYLISLDFEVAPSVTCWVNGLFGFCACVIPVLVFLFPYSATSEVDRSVHRALVDIEDELNR
jgi:hypothetical protein